MAVRRAPAPSRAGRGLLPTGSTPEAKADTSANSASALIESPRKPGRNPLVTHDFADGGGGGGAEAFSRKRVKARKKG